MGSQIFFEYLQDNALQAQPAGVISNHRQTGNTHMTHTDAVLNIVALIGLISAAGLVFVTFDAAREAFKNR
jgi:hypothetical protein